MAEGYKPKHINPPDLAQASKVASLVASEITPFTSAGGWYCVKGINYGYEGGSYAYIMNSSATEYLSTSTAPDGAYVRNVTSWLYFPKGAVFNARANFTDSNLSGIFFAPELN